ncbi:MAG: branched-chain amino acid ABC transporter permease, partial [Candidatus Tectomicrobia bacterium]|nr:branched-chain amino acid ABC transporter permease [Candidatus Tectomicrobia bacterium]
MIQIVVNGLVNGAILALMAICLTIIFSILRVPHFGLGGVFVWGAFTAYLAATGFGLDLASATLLAAAAMALLGVVIEKLAFKGLRG